MPRSKSKQTRCHSDNYEKRTPRISLTLTPDKEQSRKTRSRSSDTVLFLLSPRKWLSEKISPRSSESFHSIEKKEKIDSLLKLHVKRSKRSREDVSTRSDVLQSSIQEAQLDDHLGLTKKQMKKMKKLGTGTSGTVFFCREATDKCFAVKFIPQKYVNKRPSHVENEVTILSVLKGQVGFSQIQKVQRNELGVFIYLDLYRTDMLELLDVKDRFTENETKSYLHTIVEGINTLHSHNIVYRDLKLENILVGFDGRIALADFGHSRILNEGETLTGLCGTLEYLAPEIILKLPYSYPIDWWMLGNLIFEMITGVTAYEAETTEDLFEDIVNKPMIFPISLSASVISLIAGLTLKDPTQRFSYPEVITHPFLSQ